jgi:hypothetical protein
MVTATEDNEHKRTDKCKDVFRRSKGTYLDGVRKDLRKLEIKWKKEPLERHILEEQRLKLWNCTKNKKIITYYCKL